MALLGLLSRNNNNNNTAPSERKPKVTNTAPAEPKPKIGELTVGDYANAMPRIRLGEFVRSFFRQLIWVIPLFLIGLAGIWLLVKDIQRAYTGDGRLLVQLGSEYVYESVTGASTGNVLMTPDHIVLNEIGIMKNPEVIESVVGAMIESYGQERFDKAAFKKISMASDQERENAWVALFKNVDKAYTVEHKPKSSIVNLSYEHEDPEIAIATVNTFIDKYLAARKEIFVDGSTDAIAERRRATQAQLDRNEAELFAFLQENGISDYQSERTGITERTEALRTEINRLLGDLTEAEEALASVERQLRNTPELQNLYVDDRASQRVAQAELELRQLLAKYLPGSAPVVQKQTEIEQLRSGQSGSIANVQGGRRVGPNPVHQDLMTRRNGLQSRVDSLREKQHTLNSQLVEADGYVKRLQNLSPEYQDLMRDRETLDTRLSNYTAREQEALINRDQAEANSENVKVISRATRAKKGSNKRLILFLLGTVAWGFILFVASLIKVFVDPKLYVPGASTQGRIASAFHDRRGSPRDGSARNRGSDNRGRSTDGASRRRADERSVPPEAVPNGPPMPAAVPLAATAAMSYQAPASFTAYDTAQPYNDSQVHPVPEQDHVMPQFEEMPQTFVPSEEANPYQEAGANPYQDAVENPYQEAGTNPYQEAGAPAQYEPQPFVQGNTALDVSANPYMELNTQDVPHLQSVPSEAEPVLPVLGTVPTQS